MLPSPISLSITAIPANIREGDRTMQGARRVIGRERLLGKVLNYYVCAAW